MYDVHWDKDTGGILLLDKKENGVKREIRPVFFEELDLLGFGDYWKYPHSKEPLLWATAGRRYYYRGELVAEAKGGGLFTKPQLHMHRKDLIVEPVDIDATLSKNRLLLRGIVQDSLSFICETYKQYQNIADIAAVAFSGGKDSLVLLDLVQRALEPDQFVIVFNDTDMEISDTYRAIEKSKEQWPHLDFHTTRSYQSAQTTWEQMGPPSRIHRWCCSVHKSAPTLLLLRQLVGKPSVKALIFDGVRWEESPGRANYNEVTIGGKHKTQINASPIISWNAGEVFLYLLGRKIMLNDAYRYGIVRVGCAVCPMAAQWWDIISWRVYRKDMLKFINKLRNYAVASGVDPKDINRYVEDGNWKRRAGGRYLANGGNKIYENLKNDNVIFTLHQPCENWQEWAKTLGRQVLAGKDSGFIERGENVYPYTIKRFDSSVVVTITGLAKADRYTLSAFRAVAIKSAYCCHCQACQVECPMGALNTKEQVKISAACTACGKCLDLHGRTCLTYSSLKTSDGGLRMSNSKRKPLHTYQRFGMRKEWLEKFLILRDDWLKQNNLGTCQVDAMLLWLRHAELISGKKNSIYITTSTSKLASYGINSLVTWAIIWTNLARNSTLVQWYCSETPWGATLTKAECAVKLGVTHTQSESTRGNATKALFNLLIKTPLGNGLKLGDTIQTVPLTIHKMGWQNPDPIPILYSLYRYAEKTKRYEFTVKELYRKADEGPYTLFGVKRKTLERILRGLATRDSDFIKVEMVRDLDNIYLNDIHKAIEVLDLVSLD